jgi:capsular exopolysaccharide synthesis family protein
MSAAPAARSELELRDYLGVLKRRKLSIILSVVVVVGVVMAYTFVVTPVYEARASLIIEEALATTILNPSATSGSVTDEDVATEAKLMDSRPIRRFVTEALGYEPDVKLATESGIPAIDIKKRSTDPEEAQRSVNDFAAAYVTVRQETLQKSLNRSLADVDRQILSLDAQVAADRRRIREIEFLLSDPSIEEEDAELLEIEKARLEQVTDPVRVVERQNELATVKDALSTKVVLTRSGDNFTISGAAVPTSPAEPQPIRNLAFALALGLLIGLTIAFSRDYLDDTLRTKEDLDAASGNLPVLALVPLVQGWRDRGSAVLESVTNTHSAPSEAYRSLRTALAFAALDRPMKTIQITSSTSGEGKTTTSANLAVMLAEAGKRVLLVDCDLRRPRVHEFFNLDNQIGFADVLLGTTSIEQAIRPTQIPGLSILPSGPPPPNPAELLSTRATRDLLEKLATEVDHVIVDSPPLIPVADSSTLALYVDAVILVVTARVTSRRSLNRSVEILEQIDAPLEGLLFNGIGREASYGYGAYTYAYEAPKSKAKAKAKDKDKDKAEAQVD